MRLTEINSPITKGLLRGLQGKESSSETERTLNRLRKTVSANDAGVVEDLLYENPIFSKLNLPEEFPTKPANFDLYTRLENRPLRQEISSLQARQIRKSGKLISALCGFRDISTFIIDLEYNQAMDLIEDFAKQFGHSIRILIKVAFIYTRSQKDSSEKKRSKEFLDACGLSQRNFVTRGAIDIMSSSYSFMSIRNNIISKTDLGNLNSFSDDIRSWMFYPIVPDASSLSNQIQSHRQASLLDATFTFFENTLGIDGGRRFGLGDKDFSPVSELCEAWCKFQEMDLPVKSFWSKQQASDREFQFYRDSIAWLEFGSVSRYRNRTDSLYCDASKRMASDNGHIKQELSSYYSNLNSVSQLSVKPDPQDFLSDTFCAEDAGIFSRTLAFLYLMELPSSDKRVTTDELLLIMNSTRDLDCLLSSSKLDVILRSNSPDNTFKLIVFTLQAQITESPRSASRLRGVFEALVIKEFEGDIIKFFDSLAELAPEVSKYLFELCDERFLDFLYELIPEGSTVLETRAELLRWYGRKFDEDSFIERARVMEIDEKIRRVRGTIDDTRIYVDTVRFTHWIQDTFLDEINAISREETPTLEEVSRLSRFDKYEDTNAPEYRMALVLQHAFEQFCENTYFGIAAYLGRRIRHGTLEGVLTSRIEEMISKALTRDFAKNPNIEVFLNSWFSVYKNNVDLLGKEFLQIKSKAKPKGLISNNIWGDLSRIRASQGVLYELLSTIKKDDGVSLSVPLIIRSCWQLVQSDLLRIRSTISNDRVRWGTINLSEVLKRTQDDKRTARTFCRNLNLATDEAFNLVVSWFHQPQDMVSSAPLSVLFEAVLVEVQEAFPRFCPKIELAGQSEITLTGGVYHIVYDTMFILVGNAAKHGPKDGCLQRELDIVETESGGKELLVSIGSECPDKANQAVVEKLLCDALCSDNSGANSLDKGSGFRKLVHLRDCSRELKRIDYSFDDHIFRVNLYFELLA